MQYAPTFQECVWRHILRVRIYQFYGRFVHYIFGVLVCILGDWRNDDTSCIEGERLVIRGHLRFFQWNVLETMIVT